MAHLVRLKQMLDWGRYDKPTSLLPCSNNHSRKIFYRIGHTMIRLIVLEQLINCRMSATTFSLMTSTLTTLSITQYKRCRSVQPICYSDCHNLASTLCAVMLGVFILSVVMLSVIRLSVIMQRVIRLSVIMLSVVMLCVVMLSIVNLDAFCLAECHYVERRYGESHGAKMGG